MDITSRMNFAVLVIESIKFCLNMGPSITRKLPCGKATNSIITSLELKELTVLGIKARCNTASEEVADVSDFEEEEADVVA